MAVRMASGKVIEQEPKPALVSVPLTPAQQRLAQLRALRGGLTEPLDAGGATYHIKRLNWPELSRLAFLTGRDREAQPLPEGASLQTSLAATVLQLCAYADAAAAQPSFTRHDAWDYVEEPMARALVQAITAKAVELTPEILGGDEEGEKKGPAPSTEPAPSTSEAGG